MTGSPEPEPVPAEAAAEAARLTGVPWTAITDARKDQFCCNDVVFVLRPTRRAETGIAIIRTIGLYGYSPDEGLNMYGAARDLAVLLREAFARSDLQRLTRPA